MKTTRKTIFTLALLLAFAVSCKDSFLEVTPAASITDAQLSSKAGLEGMLVGAYAMLHGRAGFYDGSTNWLWGHILGGDANKGTNSGDQSQVNEIQAYASQSTNASVLGKYQNTYEGIARVNALLRLLPDGPADTGEPGYKLRLEGEAKFLRGHYYFELKKIYNNTPYIDETIDYATGINDIGNDADLWPKIEADLQFAYTNLPETQGAVGRANKWAAASYLAKAQLFQGKYAAAKALFDVIRVSGKTSNNLTYALLPTYGALFRASNDNNSESIFAIQAAAGTGTINNANPDFVLNYPYNGGPAGCCGFNQPSFDLANSFRTVAGLPIIDGTHSAAANELKTDQGVAATDPFTPDAGTLDPRIDHAIGRRGIPYLDHGKHPGIAWIRDQSYGGPYAPKKFIWTKAEEAGGSVDKSSWTPGYIATNVPIIRYADVLLMAAECEVELGNLEAARALVNQVRARADNAAGYVMDGTAPAANYNMDTYNTVWTVQADARNAVRMERRLELSDEGHRFFDLVRWGISAPYLTAYLTYERGKVSASPFLGASFAAKSNFQPIPQREIDIIGSTLLKQNPGY